MHRRPLELGADHLAEHEVPDGPASVPALEALLALDQPRPGGRVIAFELLEPGNPGVTVPLLAAAFCAVEVRPQLLRVGVAKAERPQPAQALVGVHPALSPREAAT